MKSEELQHLTASEPLSLEEEYQMQQSWQIDDNSLYLLVKAYNVPCLTMVSFRTYLHYIGQTNVLTNR